MLTVPLISKVCEDGTGGTIEAISLDTRFANHATLGSGRNDSKGFTALWKKPRVREFLGHGSDTREASHARLVSRTAEGWRARRPCANDGVPSRRPSLFGQGGQAARYEGGGLGVREPFTICTR